MTTYRVTATTGTDTLTTTVIATVTDPDLAAGFAIAAHRSCPQAVVAVTTDSGEITWIAQPDRPLRPLPWGER